MWPKYTKINIILCIFIALMLSPGKLAAMEPQITAQSAVVIEQGNGRIIYAKNGFERRPPASLTKVMTAILTIESVPMDHVVTVSKEAAFTTESRLGLVEGEKITVENLLYGALLRSGNDACVALAQAFDEDTEQFIRRMNLKALLLGCGNTHFTNTNGLPDAEHYSTAYDLALITRYAMANDAFQRIVSTEAYEVNWVDGRKKKIKNTNRLLYLYDGAIGVKTGTTNAAGQCLIASAQREGKTYIAVVLKSMNRFFDAEILLNYAFERDETGNGKRIVSDDRLGE